MFAFPSPVRSYMPIMVIGVVAAGLGAVVVARALARGGSRRWVLALRTARSDIRDGLFARHNWVGIVLGSFVVLAGPVLGAEKVGIETGLHDGFGRIVFAWPEPIKFVATIGEQGLTIKFERPLNADLALIAKQLPHYVEGASMDGDSTACSSVPRMRVKRARAKLR